MIKIKVDESLSSREQYHEASVVFGPIPKRPLEQLIDDAKKLGFDLVEIDIAEIHDEFTNKPYESPVILLFNKEQGTHAVISQKESIFLGHSFSLHSYHPED